MLDADLIAYLKADTAVAALVAGRIYADFIPDSAALPAIEIERPSETPQQSNDGPVGFAESKYVFRCISTGKSEARALAAAVRARMDNLKGTVGGSVIGASTLEDESDVPVIDTQDARIRFGVELTFSIWHDE